jgi:hypothetical protein
MMMNGLVRSATFLAIALLTFATGALAQSLDQKVRTGMAVVVVDDWGDRYRGRVEHVSADRIRLFHLGDLVEISADAIRRVDKPQELGNGAAIGAVGGISLGIVVGVTTKDSPLPRLIGVPILAGVFGIVGEAMGLLIDAVIHRPRTLYVRPAHVIVGVVPVTTFRSKGVAVNVSW